MLKIKRQLEPSMIVYLVWSKLRTCKNFSKKLGQLNALIFNKCKPLKSFVKNVQLLNLFIPFKLLKFLKPLIKLFSSIWYVFSDSKQLSNPVYKGTWVLLMGWVEWRACFQHQMQIEQWEESNKFNSNTLLLHQSSNKFRFNFQSGLSKIILGFPKLNKIHCKIQVTQSYIPTQTSPFPVHFTL